MRTQRLLALFGVTILIAGFTGACAQIEQRDKRFYYRALWNFALRENLQALDIEFNGVDFGHSNLYENLLLTGAKDIPAIEDRARKETLRFIDSRPVLNPNEEAIAPNYMKLAWKAQNTFDEAHALHRATYDIYVSDLVDKETAIRKVVAFYRDSQYAITAKRLDHQRLDTFSCSRSSTPPSGPITICKWRCMTRWAQPRLWPSKITSWNRSCAAITAISTSHRWNGPLCP